MALWYLQIRVREARRMSITQGFERAAIGKWSEPAGFPITRDRIRAYAAATNDPIAQHVAGDYASPVFASVPVYAPVSRALIGAIPGHLLMMALPTAPGLPLPRATAP
jgi:hypothetical protein